MTTIKNAVPILLIAPPHQTIRDFGLSCQTFKRLNRNVFEQTKLNVYIASQPSAILSDIEKVQQYSQKIRIFQLYCKACVVVVEGYYLKLKLKFLVGKKTLCENLKVSVIGRGRCQKWCHI